MGLKNSKWFLIKELINKEKFKTRKLNLRIKNIKYIGFYITAVSSVNAEKYWLIELGKYYSVYCDDKWYLGGHISYAKKMKAV